MKYSYLIVGIIPLVLLGIYFLVVVFKEPIGANSLKEPVTPNPIPGISLMVASPQKNAYAYSLSPSGLKSDRIEKGSELPIRISSVLEVVGSAQKTVCNRYRIQLQWSPVQGEKVDLYIDGEVQGSIKNSGYFWYEEKILKPASKTYQLCPAGQAQCSNKLIIDFD